MISYEPSEEIITSVNKMLSYLDMEYQSIKYLGKGEGSLLYIVITKDKKYCLKIALFERRSKKVRNEAKIRDEFISKGLDFIPAPIYVDKQFFENGAVLYEFIEGEECKYDSASQLRELARNLAMIHQLDYKMDDAYVKMRNQIRFLEEVVDYLEERFPQYMNPKMLRAFVLASGEYLTSIDKNKDMFGKGISSILHGDVSNNVIIDPEGKLWMIDWENSEYGDSIEEVCSFVYNRGFNDEMLGALFEEYQSTFPEGQQVNIARIYQYYWMLIPVFNVCWGLDQFAMNVIHQIEPERKLHDIKQSALEWKKYYSEEAVNTIIEGVEDLVIKYRSSTEMPD